MLEALRVEEWPMNNKVSATAIRASDVDEESRTGCGAIGWITRFAPKDFLTDWAAIAAAPRNTGVKESLNNVSIPTNRTLNFKNSALVFQNEACFA
jgi:hypothetical protein